MIFHNFVTVDIKLLGTSHDCLCFQFNYFDSDLVAIPKTGIGTSFTSTSIGTDTRHRDPTEYCSEYCSIFSVEVTLWKMVPIQIFENWESSAEKWVSESVSQSFPLLWLVAISASWLIISTASIVSISRLVWEENSNSVSVKSVDKRGKERDEVRKKRTTWGGRGGGGGGSGG